MQKMPAFLQWRTMPLRMKPFRSRIIANREILASSHVDHFQVGAIGASRLSAQATMSIAAPVTAPEYCSLAAVIGTFVESIVNTTHAAGVASVMSSTKPQSIAPIVLSVTGENNISDRLSDISFHENNEISHDPKLFTC